LPDSLSISAFSREATRKVPWCSSSGVMGDRYVYFEKIRVLKAGVALIGVRPNNVAWNNGIGPRPYFVGLKCLR
jgi:hypothetical protein